MSIERDITTYFVRHVAYNQKLFHENFITKNSILFKNIDFEKSKVIEYLL